jgi:hypothetical protein
MVEVERPTVGERDLSGLREREAVGGRILSADLHLHAPRVRLRGVVASDEDRADDPDGAEQHDGRRGARAARGEASAETSRFGVAVGHAGNIPSLQLNCNQFVITSRVQSMKA